MNASTEQYIKDSYKNISEEQTAIYAEDLLEFYKLLLEIELGNL